MLNLSQCAYKDVARIDEDTAKLCCLECPGSLTCMTSNKRVGFWGESKHAKIHREMVMAALLVKALLW